MRLHGATASHVGNLRDANQDRAWFKGAVAALADGMGGHQGGERAAELAIGEFMIMPETLTPDELIDVVEEANRQVHKQSVNPDLRGMGTTMVALGLHEGMVLVVNVGDSRAYRLRNGELIQITVDHSFVEELVRQGRLTPEEAAVHPQRNIVTRALGIGPEVEVDEFPLEPQLGDRYLLASDGLFSEVQEHEIRQILEAGVDPGTTATTLVEAALETPCRDNVTVAVVDVVDDDFVIPADYEPEQVLTGSDIDITAPVPIVATEVVKITDRPDGGAAARGGVGTLLEREHVSGEHSDLDFDRRLEAEDAARGSYQSSKPSMLSRLTSVLGTFLILASLIAVGFFAIEWYAKSAYFVGEIEDELVIYQGRKGGFLWVDGELLPYRSGVELETLTTASIDSYETWGDFSSLDSARMAIEGLETQLDGSLETTEDADEATGLGASASSQDANESPEDNGADGETTSTSEG